MKTLQQLLAKTLHHTTTASSHLFSSLFLYHHLLRFWFSPTYDTTPFPQYFQLHLLFLNYISLVRLWVSYDLGKGRCRAECKGAELVRPATGNEVQEGSSVVLFSTVYPHPENRAWNVPGLNKCSLNQ